MSCLLLPYSLFFFFFFNDTATTEIYTLSLHDALPISSRYSSTPGSSTTTPRSTATSTARAWRAGPSSPPTDRKSTRLNSSHANISYAVFCLKKKNKKRFSSLAYTPDITDETHVITHIL